MEFCNIGDRTSQHSGPVGISAVYGFLGDTPGGKAGTMPPFLLPPAEWSRGCDAAFSEGILGQEQPRYRGSL